MIDILNSVEASSEDTNPASSGDSAEQDASIDLGDFMGEVGEIQITLLQTSEADGDNSGEKINKAYLKRPLHAHLELEIAATNYHLSVIIDSYNLRDCRWPHTHHQAEKRVAVLLKNIPYGQSSAKLPVIMSS